MKIAASVASYLIASAANAQAHHDGDDKLGLRGHNRWDDPASRSLTSPCVGNSLQANEELLPDQSICANIGGHDVSFGLFSSAMAQPGYTMYRIELRSTNSDYNRFFSGIGTQGEPPTLKLQGDGNLVFGGQSFSSCITMPGTVGNQLTIAEDDEGELELQITDSDEEVIWRLNAGECYPLVEDSCTPALFNKERLGWKEYLCTYGPDGNIEYRFGLNSDVGLFGLWKGGSLIWRPDGGTWARGDFLHFQEDGHITLYRDTTPKQYVWTSGDCIDFTAHKLVLTSDGDVQELNYDGAVVWSLQGSQAPPDASVDPRNSVPQICMPSNTCAIPPTTPLFLIDDNVDIGDTLIRPGPGFVSSCGPRCYDVLDNGDDPPFDPELGDTLRFAYKEVSSTRFMFRAKVCGTECVGYSSDSAMGILGNVGLMVRESLDPFAKNLFVSHEPDSQATWSYRTETGGDTVFQFDGSPDVECLWLTLERQSRDVFRILHSYEGSDGCTSDELNVLDTMVTIEDMPETVLLGMSVASGIAPPYCPFTEARFSHIQLDEE